MRSFVQFGDGIMSMIDCNIHVDKKPHPKGDRVVLTFECVLLDRYCIIISGEANDTGQWQILTVCDVVKDTRRYQCMTTLSWKME